MGASVNWESCVVERPDSRSSFALGMDWASRVTTIGLEFALPIALGFGVDSWLHTTPAGTIIGAVLGFATGMSHAVRIARQLGGGPGSRGGRSPDERNPQGPPTP
jgi:F0F1-type ATP synthase assembly protein I